MLLKNKVNIEYVMVRTAADTTIISTNDNSDYYNYYDDDGDGDDGDDDDDDDDVDYSMTTAT